MPVFAYKGRSSRGDLVQGSLEGADSGVVADQLLNTGITPTEINLTSQAIRSGSNPEVSWWTKLTREKKVDTLELMLFSRRDVHAAQGGRPDHACLGRAAGIHK